VEVVERLLLHRVEGDGGDLAVVERPENTALVEPDTADAGLPLGDEAIVGAQLATNAVPLLAPEKGFLHLV